MLKIIKQISILILLVLILMIPFFVFGAEDPPPLPTMREVLEDIGKSGGYKTEGVDQTTVSAIAGTAVKAFLSILGIIFVVLMLYGGYLWMTARGKEEQVEKAKELIRAAIIGLIIIVAAYAIAFFIFSYLGRETLGPGGGGGAGTGCESWQFIGPDGGCYDTPYEF